MRLCTREDYQRLNRKEDDHPVDNGEIYDELVSIPGYNELCVDTWENVIIWGIKKMTSFTDFRIRAIACDNKTKEGEPCAPLQEINEFMAGV